MSRLKGSDDGCYSRCISALKVVEGDGERSERHSFRP